MAIHLRQRVCARGQGGVYAAASCGAPFAGMRALCAEWAGAGAVDVGMMQPAVQTENYSLYLGDSLEVLPALEAGSVDCVCADPPYGTTACKWDSVIPFAPMWAGIKHVVKPRAAVVLFGSQPFTSALVMSNVECYKHRWIWNKRLPGNFAVVKHMPLTIDEDILVFTSEGERANYYPVMTIGKWHKRGGGNSKKNGRGFGGLGNVVTRSNKYFPKSILEFPTVSRHASQHESQKPVALLKYLIRTYTNEGDTVLDFTMGSGTTGVAALLTGRRFVGVELDPHYFQVAAERIADAARTARREWKPLQDTQTHNDLPLFANGDA